MAKKSVKISNEYCPQTLFLYGTKNEDGSPDFGLFCWATYAWNDGLCFLTCIGENKRTKDNLLRNRAFSANLVTEKLLPLADYFGNTSGSDPNKMHIDVQIEQGKALDVPVLTDSPVCFELEVIDVYPQGNGSDVILSRIKSVLHDEELPEETAPEALQKIAPARALPGKYFGFDGKFLGNWGELQMRK